jgi:hypothetical protein
MNDNVRRKIIQIAVQDGGVLFALCDDGTIWRRPAAAPGRPAGRWEQVELPPELDPSQQ